MEEVNNAYKQNKAIERLMLDTFKKAKKLNCNITVNTKTGRMSWHKNGEVSKFFDKNE